MLTNKIFEDFASQLKKVRDASDFLSLSDGQRLADTLTQARVHFEDALSEKVRGLSEAERIQLLTQILTLFKDSHLYNPAPVYLWADLDTITESGCKWVRESDEAQSIKAFRDDCEAQMQTDPQRFLTVALSEKYHASNANSISRMVDEYETNLSTCQLEGIELEDTELDYEESRWLSEQLVSREAEKAQENVRKVFMALAGREKANQWILNPDRWYDMYREAMGLPWLQEKFQASYEAWHFFDNRPTEPPKALLPHTVVTPELTHPWAEIEALAERIELRFRGKFVPANKWIAAATAGMIDALCEAKILPASGELERLYSAFTQHYGRSIKADRVTHTRALWQKKARKELGLE